MIDFKSIEAVDPELCGAMRKELTRQREHLELIASENFVSDAVLAAMGSHLTNKYAEDTPENGITAAVSMLISLRIWHVNEPKRFSAQSMRMCSRIPAHRPTWLSILPCLNRAIR